MLGCTVLVCHLHRTTSPHLTTLFRPTHTYPVPTVPPSPRPLHRITCSPGATKRHLQPCVPTLPARLPSHISHWLLTAIHCWPELRRQICLSSPPALRYHLDHEPSSVAVDILSATVTDTDLYPNGDAQKRPTYWKRLVLLCNAFVLPELATYSSRETTHATHS